jgi:hypothetical protein
METVMDRESDRDYLEKRAREERARAENAGDPCACKTHLNLARAYERRLKGLMESATAQAQPGRTRRTITLV